MKLKTIIAVLCVLSVSSLSSTLRAQDKSSKAHEILDRYIEVTGGLKKYKEMKTMETKGTVKVPLAGLKGTIEVYQDIENTRMYTKVTLPGAGVEETGTDGETCWRSSVMMGGVSLLEDEIAEQMKEQTTYESVWNYKEFYKKINYKGESKVNGKAAHEIEYVREDDSTSTAFFSVETGLQVKGVTTQKTPEGAMEIVSHMFDYKEAGGILSPTKVEQKLPNGMVMIIETSEVVANEKIDEKVFALPAEVKKLADAKKKREAKKKAEKAEPAGAGK